MASEMQSIGGTSLFRQLQAQLAARKAWEHANPELAADWSAALREDHARQVLRERELRESDFLGLIPKHLRAIGVPLDAVESIAPDRLRDSEPGIVAAKKFLDAPATEARFLVLFGRKGTGKTVAAALVLAHAVLASLRRNEGAPTGMQREVDAEFILASTFARLSGYDAADKAWFEVLCSTRMLVLDDFGGEPLSQFGMAMLTELLTRRHGDRLRTVITTNLDKKAFADRVGERLFDRISTSGISAIASGESMRRKAPR